MGGLARVVLAACVLASVAAEAQEPQSAATLLRGIESRPWFEVYTLADTLFEDGRKDEAAKWLYVAQIRSQAVIRCGEDSLGAQLRGFLNEAVGRNINEYLHGSIARAVRVIDEALAWVAANPDPLLPLPKCAKALEIARADKRKQREWTLANANQIRQQRAENGLPNEDD